MNIQVGDKIKVTEYVRERNGYNKINKKYRVKAIYPNFLVVDNGRYKTSIHKHDLESGELEFKIIR